MILRRCFTLLLLGVQILHAQDERSLAIRQSLLDLSNDMVVMNLSAHPDDEDGASLAYYRMKYGAKTYSVLFTRGEGGQNEKGPELYEELGVLRSQETEQAGRILGAQVCFLNLLDFGYSKTASEAYRMWGGQKEVLRRLVFVIRKYKPDVLFTNHNTIDGHGHHQAVAITAIAAFDAAGDSTYFPEQLREHGITLWQPRKLFFRAFGRSEPIADVSNSIETTAGDRGMTYLDIAAEALRMHRTQGLDRANLRAFTRGKSLYKLVRANSLYDLDSTSFLSGIDLFHDPSVASLASIRAELNLLHFGMSPDSILSIVSSVQIRCDSVRAAGKTSILAQRMIAHWAEEGGMLALRVCNLTATVVPRDPIVVPQQRVACDCEVTSPECSIADVRWSFAIPAGWAINEEPLSAPVLSPHANTRRYTLIVADDARLTLPPTITQYRPLEQREEIHARLTLRVNGRPLWLDAALLIAVAPRQSIVVEPRAAALPRTRLKDGVTIGYTIRNFLPHKTAGRVGVRAPAGWSADNAAFTISAEDSVARGRLVVRPPAGIPSGDYVLHIRTDQASEPVTVRVIDAALAPDVMLGIIKSYDTMLESAAATLGVNYALLSDADLASADLNAFTTIVVDIRAYLVRETLRKHNDRLLEYVRRGGNLVVMYQREQEWKPEYAPFPFQITRRRVCVEEAPVTILAPGHPLVTAPNRIGPPDWLGWKQERALYFPGNVPDSYASILATGDPDEPPLTTGYLVAPFGRGSYIYTSFVWYRQMKEGNPGAFRNFANMISYPAFRKAAP